MQSIPDQLYDEVTQIFKLSVTHDSKHTELYVFKIRGLTRACLWLRLPLNYIACIILCSIIMQLSIVSIYILSTALIVLCWQALRWMLARVRNIPYRFSISYYYNNIINYIWHIHKFLGPRFTMAPSIPCTFKIIILLLYYIPCPWSQYVIDFSLCSH